MTNLPYSGLFVAWGILKRGPDDKHDTVAIELLHRYHSREDMTKVVNELLAIRECVDTPDDYRPRSFLPGTPGHVP